MSAPHPFGACTRRKASFEGTSSASDHKVIGIQYYFLGVVLGVHRDGAFCVDALSTWCIRKPKVSLVRQHLAHRRGRRHDDARSYTCR